MRPEGVGVRGESVRGVGIQGVSIQGVGERLRHADMVQFLVGFFALLLFTVAVTWPSGAQANDSWFSLVQVEGTALILLAVGFGSGSAAVSARERLHTLLALLCFYLLGLPFALATYAASFPETPLWWPLLMQPVDTTAYFGAGLLLGHLLGRVQALLPLIPPLVLIGAISFDVWLGRAVLNPVTTTVMVAPAHLAVTLTAVCLTAFHLGRALRHNRKGEDTSQPASS